MGVGQGLFVGTTARRGCRMAPFDVAAGLREPPEPVGRGGNPTVFPCGGRRLCFGPGPGSMPAEASVPGPSSIEESVCSGVASWRRPRLERGGWEGMGTDVDPVSLTNLAFDPRLFVARLNRFLNDPHPPQIHARETR